MRAALGQSGVSFSGSGTTFTLTISKSNRQAIFDTSDSKCVKLSGLSGFTKYDKDTSSACTTIKKI